MKREGIILGREDTVCALISMMKCLQEQFHVKKCQCNICSNNENRNNKPKFTTRIKYIY